MSLVFCTYAGYMPGYNFPLIGNKFPQGFKLFIIYFLLRIFTENTNSSIAYKCHNYSSSLTAAVSSTFSCLDLVSSFGAVSSSADFHSSDLFSAASRGSSSAFTSSTSDVSSAFLSSEGSTSFVSVSDSVCLSSPADVVSSIAASLVSLS